MSTAKPKLLAQLLSLYKQATSVWVPGDPVCQTCTEDNFCKALRQRNGWMGPFATVPAA